MTATIGRVVRVTLATDPDNPSVVQSFIAPMGSRNDFAEWNDSALVKFYADGQECFYVWPDGVSRLMELNSKIEVLDEPNQWTREV